MKIVSPFPDPFIISVWEWLQEFSPQMVDDYTPKTLEQVYQQHIVSRANGAKQYAIYSDNGQPLGAVWGELLGDDMYTAHLVFNRGLEPKEKANLARAALKRFFQDGARKICWQCFADNLPFRNFLMRRLGAKIEGCFRQATRRNGELVDQLVLATFPEDIS